MGPGTVSTVAGGWITTVESGHCRTQGSLQLSASGAGAATPHTGAHRLEQDIFHAGKEYCKVQAELDKVWGEAGKLRGRERAPRSLQEQDLPRRSSKGQVEEAG